MGYFDQPLKISNNKKYILKGDKAFFWLGETAWLMLRNLSKAEIYTFLRNRKEKGYNVIQVNLIWDIPRELDSKKLPMKDLTPEGFWEFVEEVLEMAKEMELYLVLLPTWGSIVKEGILNQKNVVDYAEFLGKRFKKYKSIIWMLGGDIRGDEALELYKTLGRILKSYNPQRLITFHPFGRTTSSLWFHEELWLDFNTYQSGHRRYDQANLGLWDDNTEEEIFYGEDNWKYVYGDHSLEIVKPTLDAEPSYEAIPQGLHNPHNLFWEEWDVRRYAYWSVFAGAAGHTYGSNAIMQFYVEDKEPGAFGVRESWQDAIHHSGGSQLQYLKSLMLSLDWISGKPADNLLLYGQKERYHRIAVFAGSDYLVCYNYLGDEFMLDLKDYMDKKMDAYWMNPQDGTYSYIETYRNTEKIKFSPVRRKDYANDWVLLLKKVGN